VSSAGKALSKFVTAFLKQARMSLEFFSYFLDKLSGKQGSTLKKYIPGLTGMYWQLWFVK
jgi:hypothetical protein